LARKKISASIKEKSIEKGIETVCIRYVRSLYGLGKIHRKVGWVKKLDWSNIEFK
jgi:hypothetical protein